MPLLDEPRLLVREYARRFGRHAYDLHDSISGALVGTAREPRLSLVAWLLKVAGFRSLAPFFIELRDQRGELVGTLSRQLAPLRRTVTVRDRTRRSIGSVRLSSGLLRPSCVVVDRRGHRVASTDGDWSTWTIRLIGPDGVVIARITRQWAGPRAEWMAGQHYHSVEFSSSVTDAERRLLCVAASLCADAAYHCYSSSRRRVSI